MQPPHETSGHKEATKATTRLAVWTLAWTASLALARYGPTHLWDSRPAVTWAAVAVNLAVGVGWIIAHARYLRGIDELQRKINLDALAITLGVGLVGGFSYLVADAAELITSEVNVAVFPVVLAVVYILTIAVGHLRYR